MAVLDQLEPKNVFYFFEELCKIPHATFDTKRISDYCVAFAKERGLEVTQDEANNVIIRKPGTEGYENSSPIILQGHLDMVCEKTEDSDHDFTKDGLKLYIEDGFIQAKDTSLGGDDGIAVAMAMAILDSSDIPHPPIEAVFTTDEESGMGGAEHIDLSVLKGHTLINIDSEEEGILTVGCAGGISSYVTFPLQHEEMDGTVFQLKISGLKGGHSGTEIHQQRGNALKLMGRLLHQMQGQFPVRLISLEGGSKQNVIAMNCTARFLTDSKNAAAVEAAADAMLETWKKEFSDDEPGIKITLSKEPQTAARVVDEQTGKNIISFLYLMPYGVRGFVRKLDGLVETSLNPGVLRTTEEAVRVEFQIRSSMESQKSNLKEEVEALAALCQAECRADGDYPAWSFREDSPLRSVMEDVYREMYQKDPVITTIHAGLECGLFLGKRPDLDCVSFGPDLSDVHSVNERLDIASVQRTYEYLKAVLAKCK